MIREVLVKTCQRNSERRYACADAWARDLVSAGVQVWFVEGGHRRLNIIEKCRLVQLPEKDKGLFAAGDEYRDNSRKLRGVLALWSALNDFPFDMLFVCDDDTFIHAARWLAHEPAGELECRVYRASEEERQRHGLDQWVHGGPGWWMSRRLCQKYVEQANERTSGDDVVVARIAKAAGIEMVDRPDLYGGDHYCGRSDVVSADNQLITCHPVLPEAMQALQASLR